MKFGSARGRNMLLLVALLATLVLLGSWDNRVQMQRVLEDGYATMAQVTGAHYQRLAPLAAEGWRPRFVEQNLSVDLNWKGKDGKTRERRKVPVSDAFERSIVSGEQVRLVTVPAKVLDDDTAVPVITSDAGPRLASLQTWISMAGYIALTAWAGFAAASLFAPKPAGWAGSATAGPTVPPRRTLLGLALIVVGAFLAFQAWSEGRANEPAALGGSEIMADVTDVTTVPGKDGAPPVHLLRLSWKDGQGGVHHFGPTKVSEAFWSRISRDGRLTVRQTPIRLREGDPMAFPVLAQDAPEERWQVRAAMIGGMVLLVLGAGLLISAARYVARQHRK